MPQLTQSQRNDSIPRSLAQKLIQSGQINKNGQQRDLSIGGGQVNGRVGNHQRMISNDNDNSANGKMQNMVNPN